MSFLLNGAKCHKARKCRTARTAKRRNGGQRTPWGKSTVQEGVQHFDDDQEQVVNRPVLLRCNAFRSKVGTQVSDRFFSFTSGDAQEPSAISVSAAAKAFRNVGTNRLDGVP
jgi:hypothetical protein